MSGDEKTEQLGGTEIAKVLPGTDPFEIAEHVGELKALGTALVQSGLLPDQVDSPSKAVVIMLYGRELGLPTMQSFTSIDVIKGNPSVKPRTMIALAERSGELADWYLEWNGENDVTCHVERKGRHEVTERWNLERASKMKTREKGKTISLCEKFNWRTMPKTMLEWRAIGGAFRKAFPDVIGGLYTPDEAETMVQQVQVVEVNEDEVEINREEKGVKASVNAVKQAVSGDNSDTPSNTGEDETSPQTQEQATWRTNYQLAREMCKDLGLEISLKSSHDELIEAIESHDPEADDDIPWGHGEEQTAGEPDEPADEVTLGEALADLGPYLTAGIITADCIKPTLDKYGPSRNTLAQIDFYLTEVKNGDAELSFGPDGEMVLRKGGE